MFYSSYRYTTRDFSYYLKSVIVSSYFPFSSDFVSKEHFYYIFKHIIILGDPERCHNPLDLIRLD